MLQIEFYNQDNMNHHISNKFKDDCSNISNPSNICLILFKSSI